MVERLRILLPLALLSAFLFAVPGVAQGSPSRDLPPDPNYRPKINSAHLSNPQRHNALLEADLVIDAVDDDAVDRYEYRWNGATNGQALPASVESPTVSYASIRPDSGYELEVRAIDVHGNASDWFAVWSGVTPGAPLVIVAGDSIASGYTRQWFTGDSVCTDSALSYGNELTAVVAADLPVAWAPDYINIAWAGAGAGEMLSGGPDSCGTTHEAQVDQIEDLADDESWSIVVITAGINSTNWTDVIVDLTKDTAFSFTEAGDRAACDLALHDKWNIGARSASITQNTRSTVDALSTSTNAQLFWTGYYDITGTELAPFWTPIGNECQAEMAEAIEGLHSALQAGLSSDVTWVEIDDDVATQLWAGWPHPNEQGHITIGRAVAEAVAE
jgi:hypothetical protein